MICLDSTIIIDFLKNRPNAVEACNKIKEEQIATTTVNIFEILLGIMRKKSSYDYELAGLMKFIDSLTILGFDYSSSVNAAQIASDLFKSGIQIESNDCMIAGIMLSNNCNAIVTSDIEHFKRIKGIKAEGY